MIYLDNSATTAPCREAINKALYMMETCFGNPSSLHRPGLDAHREVEAARRIVAEALGATDSEILFTGGGTESNNLAIRGAALANRRRGNKIVTTGAEHPSVARVCEALVQEGFQLTVVDAPGGVPDREALEKAIDGETVLVSMMAVNNETGAVFPVRETARLIRRKGSPALLHCDAVQALGKIPLRVRELEADLLSVSAHKIHGIKGCGALFVKDKTRLQPLLLGGGQERGLRSGTEATPLIAAMGAALEVAMRDLDRNASHMGALRQYAVESIQTALPQVIFHTSRNTAPHLLHFSLPGLRSETMLHHLDSMGIVVSSGSACSSGRKKPSPILKSLGIPFEEADSALRVSFCPDNTREDVEALVAGLVRCDRELVRARR